MTKSLVPSAGTGPKCPSCGNAYMPRRADQAYCGKACRKAGDNLALARGAQIYALAMHWRFNRGSHRDHLRVLCAELSRMHDADVAAGRPLPPLRHDDLWKAGHFDGRGNARGPMNGKAKRVEATL